MVKGRGTLPVTHKSRKRGVSWGLCFVASRGQQETSPCSSLSWRRAWMQCEPRWLRPGLEGDKKPGKGHYLRTRNYGLQTLQLHRPVQDLSAVFPLATPFLGTAGFHSICGPSSRTEAWVCSGTLFDPVRPILWASLCS